MGEEWFFESRTGSRRPRRSLLSIVIIIFSIVNMSVLAYIVHDHNIHTSKLDREMEILQLQIKNLSSELDMLRDDVKILRRGNESGSLQLAQLYDQSKMSVVLVTVFGSGLGSGFVYDLEGRIITNNHVVEEAVVNDLKIEVTFIDGTISTAEIVGRDPYVDLAVIDVDVESETLSPVRLGNSSELLVGETVVAIGNPFGLADTMTAGIVSAVGRDMPAPGGYAIVDVIQTDAAINRGNSGGPLLNMRGYVVGMNTAILSETGDFAGIGFAISSDTIKREIQSLIEKGVYLHPRLGITGSDVTPSVAKDVGLDEWVRGVIVAEVDRNGPADEAGLKPNDVIIDVDGLTISTFYDLVYYLERYKRPGETIRITVIRDTKIELDLVLGEREPPSP